MAVSDWATSASGNNTTLGVNIAENCPAANINNAIRELMAQAKTKFDLTDSTIDALDTLGSALTALNALTPAANKLAYFTSGSAAALADLSSFGRSLIDDASADAACTTLGAVRVAALSLTSPGYVKLQVASGQFLFIQWGTGNASGNTTTTVTYPVAFSTFSIPVVSGNSYDLGAQDNGPATTSAGTTSFVVTNAYVSSIPFWWIAVGV